MIRNSDDINLKGVLLALVHGNVAHLKRRENMRLMGQFAVKGVAAIERERLSLGSHFEQYCVKYFDIAKRYCLNAEDLQKLVSAFKEIVKIDIVKLS